MTTPTVPRLVLPGDVLSITEGRESTRVTTAERREEFLVVTGTVEGGVFHGAAYRWDERFGGTYLHVGRVVKEKW